MRMWLVDPTLLCRQHLLGEHLEMHMFAGCIKHGISIKGYITNHLVETQLIEARHDELAIEMERRNYKHATPLVLPIQPAFGYVNSADNTLELARRCTQCKLLQEQTHVQQKT